VKGKFCFYFNINKILGFLLFNPCFLNIGSNIYYFVGFFIQQNIYFIWDSTGFCLNTVPNFGLSPAGNTEDTLANVFLEPNFRNNLNENPDGRGLNNRAESGFTNTTTQVSYGIDRSCSAAYSENPTLTIILCGFTGFSGPEILARNNGVLNLNSIGGEPILNNTSFGGMLLQEYINCLEAINILL
jgi:hypothetical protein